MVPLNEGYHWIPQIGEAPMEGPFGGCRCRTEGAGLKVGLALAGLCKNSFVWGRPLCGALPTSTLVVEYGVVSVQ